MTDTKPTNDGSFQRFWDKVTVPMSEGGMGGAIRRREVTFTISHELCEPGTFDEDIEVTLEGLNSKDELEALKGGSGGEAMGFEMAKKAIKKVGGYVLKSHEKGVFWEALGFSGRMVVANHFMAHCTGADAELLGKSLNGAELG